MPSAVLDILQDLVHDHLCARLTLQARRVRMPSYLTLIRYYGTVQLMLKVRRWGIQVWQGFSLLVRKHYRGPDTNRRLPPGSQIAMTAATGGICARTGRLEVSPVGFWIQCIESDCWDLQGPHKPSKRGRDGVAHQKNSRILVQTLSPVFEPPHDARETQRLHEDDKFSKWLALVRDDSRFYLEEYDRISQLLPSKHQLAVHSRLRPQIISFVGVTNAGKSTIVKLLIHSGAGVGGPSAGSFASPVAGGPSHDTQPTTGDVHLYADPATSETTLPMLFADCEGFEGGERPPLGARSRACEDTVANDNPWGPQRVHDIRWTDTGKYQGREGVVASLFPRILYTFSSCVVFVLRNPKTFQSAVLTKLLDWGAAALERSVNQPTLPHCVVILNAADPGLDDAEWEVNAATQTLLDSLHHADPSCRRVKDHWSRLGYEVKTTKDLLLRYYASFAAIRMPTKPSYERMDGQIHRLRRLLRAGCQQAAIARHNAGVTMSAAEFKTYLSHGLDHFTNHLFKPFDFLRIDLIRSAAPITFQDHVLQLCIVVSSAMRAQALTSESKIIRTLENLSPVLASCILLDQKRAQETGAHREARDYLPPLTRAVEVFFQEHYPCWYRSSDRRRSCKLVRARHSSKGHQDDAGIFAAGEFVSDILISWPAQWASHIFNTSAVRTIRHELDIRRVRGLTERDAIVDLHLDRLNSFHENVCPASDVTSHAICLCCNLGAAEYPLPCGHVLCGTCIREVGESNGSAVLMRCCPLHRESTRWRDATIVRFLPAGVAPRVLLLEACGVRAIVQLVILCMIEEELERLGGLLSIRTCFDLILGAGTGGLVAVVMSRANPSLRESCEFFQMLCAILPRHQRSWTRLLRMQRARDDRWIDVLKTAFQIDQTFFPPSPRTPAFHARTALVCQDSAQKESVLLANYRRQEDSKPLYRLERPAKPCDELKVWQVAAITLSSQAQRSLGSSYVGGLLDQDLTKVAERECELLFPGASGASLLLSIGPGLENSKAAQADRHEWHERSTGSERSNAERRFRVNPIIGSRLPPHRYDQFDQIYQQLQDCIGERANASQTLEGRNLTVLLRHVAYNLVASSFYLVFHKCRRGPTGGAILEGCIVCRYEHGSHEQQALGRIIAERQTEEFRPRFTVQSRPDIQQESITEVQFHERLEELEPLAFSVWLERPSDDVECRLLLELDNKIAPMGHLVSLSDWKQQVGCEQPDGTASDPYGSSQQGQGHDSASTDGLAELPATEARTKSDTEEEEGLISFITDLLFPNTAGRGDDEQ
ncbi:hypothetical protein M409DRAFT_31046 [Zasmidium cellare ATCC 36951]|uniref:RING-type domain-containing protein n=1 Tax=Zasmidium cellare ATCC 36951 TaxID=1080233 RepID=A0A6A6BYG3_ZASCE|nr:uncharacterized protein M409DRAFT_31046 [Zasmidium cellare ATCC 36951]KAF2158446.1 hypothetical protein M409DRAFT_31046 [Zasmidium cellare ATCC 36951]